MLIIIVCISVFIFCILIFYFFGKKFFANWVCNKLRKKKNFDVTNCYISGDLSWAICYDASQKKFAFFRIFKRTVDIYHITHIRKCEIEIFEGRTKKKISLPKALAGALTGRLIGGKNATAILTGATIGAATSSNLLGAQEFFIKKIYLYVVTTNNAYNIKFKPLMSSKANDNSISEAMRWHKLINNLS